MHQIVYVSSAVREYAPAELTALLAESRARNATVGVTGMLLYAGGNFFQVLEGPKGSVWETYRRIERDARHRGVILLIAKDIDEAHFPEWSMGFECFDRAQVSGIPGYQDLRRLTVEERASMGHKLLLRFLRDMTGATT